MFLVRNIKVSVKVRALVLNNALMQLYNNNIICKQFGNFISFKSNNYTFVLFKRGRKKETHVNITQIPNFQSIHKAIEVLVRLIGCVVINYVIDNIIATSDIKRSICLQKIVDERKFKKIKYNSEIFPGLFLKFTKGTSILFHSGKIVIVGSKSIENIKWILEIVHANI